MILLANDDGVNSEGLHVLWDALSELGEIVTVAPRFEQSAASHAITIRKPIKVEKLGDHFYAVHGTPADCIVVAVYGILERRPD
ncbi:MAG: 5'/3'-nucleotidase SurE, partial [Candidatus Hydrothermota bacterium]